MEEKEVKLGLSEEDVKSAVVEENQPQGGPPPGPLGLFQAMGNATADAEAIANSEDGRLIGERMSLMRWPEDSEDSKKFWMSYEKGLIKEVHNIEDPLNKWASFVPVATVKEPERKFPLIFCLHGAHNPIQLTESYGVMQVAAREECIVIAPENEREDNILALYEHVVANYPVDISRVYLMGYSFGGFMSSRNGLLRPELFAGLGWGGMLFALKAAAHDLDGQWYDAYELTPEMIAKARELEMPVAVFMGENEMLNLLPLWNELAEAGKDGIIPLDSTSKYQSFNNLRAVGGCDPIENKGGEYYSNHEDPVVRSIGVDFERTEVREYHGRKYFIGDAVKEDGECLFRTIACEKMVHWPTVMFAELAWEQISKFARDPETKKLIRL